MTMSDEDQVRLASEARRFLKAGLLGRSEVLIRLFEFLLHHSLAGRAPKEVEIAQQVFGKTLGIETADDASVRVYIHRLRRKLDEFNALSDDGSARLGIPRGEYRLVLTTPADEEIADDEIEVPAPETPAQPPASEPWLTSRRSWLYLGLLSTVNLAGWGIWGRHRPSDPFAAVEHTSFWRPLTARDRPLVIVTGDYFIFGDAPDAMQVTRLVREFNINSREDLDRYLLDNPSLAGRYVDLDLHYLPVSTAQALQRLIPLASGAARQGQLPLILRLMSQLTPDQLKVSQLLYVGLLSGLGLLRDPLFELSGFKVGASYDELVDRKTNVRYISDWAEVEEGEQPRRDFSYVASFSGPTGGRTLIVAGMRDAGLVQAAAIASDPVHLAQITSLTGNTDAFEALYEVRTVGNLDLSSRLVVARPLSTGRARSLNAGTPQSFPD